VEIQRKDERGLEERRASMASRALGYFFGMLVEVSAVALLCIAAAALMGLVILLGS
jgi:hypothetical protein